MQEVYAFFLDNGRPKGLLGKGQLCLLGNGQWNISIIKIGCFYPVSIIGSSSAHLRLISKTERGIKKRPIIKIPLC